MRATVVPYLRPPEAAVNHSGWKLVSADGESDLPPDVPHWDYQTTLHLTAAVSVDRDAVLDGCHLESDSELRVVVTGRSDSTTVRHCIANLLVPAQPTYDLAIGVELPGSDLGGRLFLETLLVVGDPRPADALAPTRPGSILWRTSHRTHLEGEGSRFPTDTADFTVTAPRNAGAGWLLHVDTSDLEAAFMSAVRLTLNTGNPRVRSMLGGGDASEQDMLRGVLRWDVVRQLVLVALQHEDVLRLNHDVESTTLGGVLRHLVASIWPREDPLIVRRRWMDAPEQIEVVVQHHARAVGGETL